MSTFLLSDTGQVHVIGAQDQMVGQNFWDVGENKKEWIEGNETQKKDNFVLYVNKRLNIRFLKYLTNFTLRTCFLQGFALHATDCFKEFSCFKFGCTMRRLLPDA